MNTMQTAETSGSALRFPHLPVPARAGVGLKGSHIGPILENSPPIGFFEVHAENYMGAGGLPHAQLTAIRENYAVSVHGVGLSIGVDGPLNKDHLARLKTVVERYEPALFSEHLARSTHDDTYFNDLLPVPYNESALQRVCDHIDEVQATVGRRMLLENPSTYVAFEDSTMSELEFLRAVVQRTGCGLLLDVNNVHVSATNHGTSAAEYLAVFPIEHVGEIHLGGHAEDQDDQGHRLLIAAHDREVDDVVWELYEQLIGRVGVVPTLVEWDNDLPEWPVLEAEAARASLILGAAHNMRGSGISATPITSH